MGKTGGSRRSGQKGIGKYYTRSRTDWLGKNSFIQKPVTEFPTKKAKEVVYEVCLQRSLTMPHGVGSSDVCQWPDMVIL